MNHNIFREYDIRGVVGKDLTYDVVYSLGKAYASYLIKNNKKKLSISGDIRISTKKLKEHFSKGVMSTGIDVLDMGILPTPVNYFSLFNSNIDCSVQVTGSHNPSDYNGFKLSYNKKPFFGKDIQWLKEIIVNNKYLSLKRKGNYTKKNILNDYLEYIYSNVSINKKIKISIDCANATGGIVVPKIYHMFNIETSNLYCDIDPTFPNHHPDPTVDENLIDLINDVKMKKSDFGVAFDGDVDRLIIVDEKGNIIRSDILLAFFVLNIIKYNETVVFDVKCSKALDEIIRECKGIPIMWKTGHSLIKDKMIESDSKIGGEMSGHIFFADKYFGYDDAVYVSLRLLEILSNTDKPLSELISRIPKYNSTPEIRISCKTDEIKRQVVVDAIKYFHSKYSCSQIDGIRINFKKGWGLIRSSNTQPVIVCRIEADNKEHLDSYKKIILDKIKSIMNKKNV